MANTHCILARDEKGMYTVGYFPSEEVAEKEMQKIWEVNNVDYQYKVFPASEGKKYKKINITPNRAMRLKPGILEALKNTSNKL